MQEKFDELYQKYLTEKLDSIFVFSEKEEFEDDKIRVVEREFNGKKEYSFADWSGNSVCDTWFDEVHKCEYGGYYTVKKDNKENIVDSNGKLLSKVWFDDVCGFEYRRMHNSFKTDYCKVKTNNKENFIDKNGRLVSDTWFDGVREFKKGVSSVIKICSHDINARTPYKWDFVDQAGERVLNYWSSNYPELEQINKSFSYVNDLYGKRHINVVCTTRDLKDYRIKEALGALVCYNENDKFKIKYKPYKIFDKNIILCGNKEDIYLYNRSINEYSKIGTVKSIEFKDNLIFNLETKQVFFVYGGDVHDITEYYNNKLKNQEQFEVREGINLISKNDFFIQREEEIRRQNEKAKKEKEIADREKLLSDEEKQVRSLQKESEFKEKKNEILLSEAYRSIIEGMEKLEKYEKEKGVCERIQVSNIIVNVGDHKELNPMYASSPTILRHIDLSLVSFKNVKIAGIDFRGCNISLNPQEVYNKDLRGCNFEGMFVPPFMDFTGTDIRGARFSQDNNPLTLDGYNTTLLNATFDETTTYNGIPFDVHIEKHNEMENEKDNENVK